MIADAVIVVAVGLPLVPIIGVLGLAVSGVVAAIVTLESWRTPSTGRLISGSFGTSAHRCSRGWLLLAPHGDAPRVLARW